LALTVEDAVRAADIAVDFVPDELESKLEIFSMIDRMAPPKTILCTPSYALSITDLASCVYRPERCVAVRGELVRADSAAAAAVRLLYPAAAAESMLRAVEGFLGALGLRVQVEADPDVPVLMKTAARAG
jgi:3-hydroxybutyryl-CoA dehydrogenase